MPFTYDPVGEAADGFITFVFNDTNIPAFTPRGEIGGSTGPSGGGCFPAQALQVLENGGNILWWQNDGNLVLYDSTRAALWNTATNPEGQQLCWRGQSPLRGRR